MMSKASCTSQWEASALGERVEKDGDKEVPGAARERSITGGSGGLAGDVGVGAIVPIPVDEI